MKLYLVQHAEAEEKDEDRLRPLSKQGRKDIEKIAKFIRKSQLKVEEIVHSGKLRAEQTATVLATYLKPTKELRISKSLEPLADPKIWREHLVKGGRVSTNNIMLVGHLPHLSKLSALLLIDNENSTIVAFSKGGVTCLNKTEDNHWTIHWIITPKMIPFNASS